MPADGEFEAVRVWLLGGFQVSVGSRVIQSDAWRLKKAASLIKLLALARGHSLHRERIMDLLWPTLNTKAASNNLRQVLHVARKTLEPTPSTASRCLKLQGEQLVLCPARQLRVDVDAFEESATTARRAREPAAYGVALELYAGELLPGDCYEGWVEGRREELRQLYLALLVELAMLREEHGQLEPAIEALRQVVSEEPAREEAHAGLARLYAVTGQHQESILQYERLRELGAERRHPYEEIRARRSPAIPSPPAGGTLRTPPGTTSPPH